MEYDICAFSQKVVLLARRLSGFLSSGEDICRLYAAASYAGGEVQPIPGSVISFTGTLFHHTDVLIYIGACGIAVRSIAPYIDHKDSDPAVLCIDETGKFVIPVLSGHIGGGNRAAEMISREIGAEAVVTTATEANGRFSVDRWASENHFVIGDMAAAKRVSAAILEKEIPFYADAPICGGLPEGLYRGAEGEIGICVSPEKKELFQDTLSIIPRVLTIGIGCRKGIPCDIIETSVSHVLEDNGLDWRAVKNVSSVSQKADEQGLLDFCEKYQLPVTFHTPEELQAVEGHFSSSEFVKKTIGVDNVCERSAVFDGGRLIVPKTIHNGVTVAVAQAGWKIEFQETKKQRVTIVGIGVGNPGMMTVEGKQVIAEADFIIGAKRMVEAAAPGRPSFVSIDGNEIKTLIGQHPEYKKIAILMSGDTGFYSGTKRLLPFLQEYTPDICPGISSIQYFCARLGTSWEDAKICSLHGRDGSIIPSAAQSEKVFALTGGENTAGRICAELSNAGLGDVEVSVGERLSYPDERITAGTAEALRNQAFDSLSVMLIRNPKASAPVINCGLPDNSFIRKPGTPMTKSEIRAVSVSKLMLERDSIVYDIGAGTGSVSVEIAGQCPLGHVYAVEYKEDAIQLIKQNKEKFGLYHLSVVEGTAPDACASLPEPTHAFIGGTSGNIFEILKMLKGKNPDVRIVMNLIALESMTDVLRCIRNLGWDYPEVVQISVAKAEKMGAYHLMKGQNPVMVMTFQMRS